MTYLLETTAVSALLDNHPLVLDRVEHPAFDDDILLASVITYGEIWFGVKRMPLGRRRNALEGRVRSLFARLPLEPVDGEVASAYADAKAYLEDHGLPIPEADIWIAATALTYGYVLVTDDAHFSWIPELRVENWLRS